MRHAEILLEARFAATETYKSCIPVPMIVGQAADLSGNKMVPGTEEYVADGVCGFAWVKITPARGPFVQYLKNMKIGSNGVYGGWEVWSSYCVNFVDLSQSMQRKEAACEAFAKVLRDNGIKAYMQSRMD